MSMTQDQIDDMNNRIRNEFTTWWQNTDLYPVFDRLTEEEVRASIGATTVFAMRCRELVTCDEYGHPVWRVRHDQGMPGEDIEAHCSYEVWDRGAVIDGNRYNSDFVLYLVSGIPPVNSPAVKTLVQNSAWLADIDRWRAKHEEIAFRIKGPGSMIPRYPREYGTAGSVVDGRPHVDQLKAWLDYDGGAGTLTWKVRRGRVKAGSLVSVVPDINQSLPYVRVNGKLLAVIDVCWALATGEWPLRRLKVRDGRELEYIRCANGNPSDIRAVNLVRAVPWSDTARHGAIQCLADYPWRGMPGMKNSSKVSDKLPDYLL